MNISNLEADTAKTAFETWAQSLDAHVAVTWVRQNQWVKRNANGGTTVIETEHGICVRHYTVNWLQNKPVVAVVDGANSLVGHRLTYKTLFELCFVKCQPTWRNTVTREITSINPFTGI